MLLCCRWRSVTTGSYGVIVIVMAIVTAFNVGNG